MAALLAPTNEGEIIDAIADAARTHDTLAIVAGGSKALIGAPTTGRRLSLAHIRGVVDYDPAELVLTVRPGTPLADVHALVAGEQQMLAFEPFDHDPIFGNASGRATIGGVVAAGVAGSQRVSCGGARDHLLGFRAVSGHGQLFVAGAKVVKNVTGFDLPKLAAGSWGRLFAMTELTLKVLPLPRVTTTLAIEGLDLAKTLNAMAAAMGSQAEVAAAAHVPGHLRCGRALTAFRIQGVGPSVMARCNMLKALFGAVRQVATLDEIEAATFWGDLRSMAPLGAVRALWRINVSPRAAQGVISDLRPLGAEWMLDWAGGLIWLSFDGEAQAVRDAAHRAGGHAMLVRPNKTMHAAVTAFHPAESGLAALETRIRRAFDPAGVFETGRF